MVIAFPKRKKNTQIFQLKTIGFKFYFPRGILLKMKVCVLLFGFFATMFSFK